MPSTYSPELRIELIANGEQSGVWGSTTNSNLGTLIEAAIASVATVSITTANQALTAVNGAADQSRNAVIDLTTTTTANFAVYIPPSSKLYIIRNSSAYAATVYCSTVIGNTTAAGVGVVIPASKVCMVWTAGVNIVEQLSHIVGAFSTTGAMSVGGALVVTGASTLTGATALSSTLAVAGAATITGAAVLSSTLAVTGATVLSSTLAVAGATVLSSTLAVTGTITTAAAITDLSGDVRSIPQNARTSAYVLTAADNGKHISITAGGVTVPTAVFSTGQVVTIFNNSASAQTITQGASTTLYNAGDGTSGDRTLGSRGIATVLCVASNVFTITGAGLT